jgi:hypothetical protein
MNAYLLVVRLLSSRLQTEDSGRELFVLKLELGFPRTEGIDLEVELTPTHLVLQLPLVA